MNTSKSLDDLVQKLGDICHEHYLGCGQNKTAPDGYEYSYDNEVINLLDSPEARQAIVEAVEGIYGDSDGLREFASTGSNQADNLLVLAAEGSGNEFAMGYDDSGCFWRFYAGARGAGSMMGEPVFHSESPEPLEALREYLQNYLGVTDLVATDKEARNG